MSALDHELRFVHAFFLPNHRDRWLRMLDSSKGRQKFLEFLPHGSHALDSRHSTNVGTWSANTISEHLRRNGASDSCYLFSEWDEIDAKTMKLDEAIATLIGCRMGSVASCLPGALAFWEGEEPNDRFICYRSDLEERK